MGGTSGKMSPQNENWAETNKKVNAQPNLNRRTSMLRAVAPSKMKREGAMGEMTMNNPKQNGGKKAARCSGKTAGGKRCKNAVRRGKRCHLHKR